MKFPGIGSLICVLPMLSCSDNAATGTDPRSKSPVSILTEEYPQDTVRAAHPSRPSARQYDLLREKITFGRATLAEVRQALTEPDAAALTNTVHALFSMRWHRGVFKLLYEMWELDRSKYPELNWEEIGKAPVRIALASTLNRMQISGTKVFQFYIRSFRDHEHEFIRAQVVVALGFNGDPLDIPYMMSMANGDNDYVAQSAIAGLGLMNNNEAQQALQVLQTELDDSRRSTIVESVLRDAYGVVSETGGNGA